MSFHASLFDASLYELVTPSKVQSLAAEWDEPEVNIDKTLRPAIAVERHPASSALLHPMLVPIVVGARAVMGVFIWYAMYGRLTLG